jgi:three-Cys-motif partner protein
VEVRREEANSAIKRLCRKDWSRHRAVLFLDPYGMQVEWTTIEAVAGTKAIDLWLLFPLGAVNRLLTRTGAIPESWRRRLNLLLGTEAWYEEFYSAESRRDLFGQNETTVVKARTNVIGRYFNERLAEIFAGVAPKPMLLLNSTRSPLYLLCFAVGNPSGKDVALRIANALLRQIQ